MKTFTVIAIDCANDDNEMHIIDAENAYQAADEADPHGTKRIVAVIEGAHDDARRGA